MSRNGVGLSFGFVLTCASAIKVESTLGFSTPVGCDFLPRMPALGRQMVVHVVDDRHVARWLGETEEVLHLIYGFDRSP